MKEFSLAAELIEKRLHQLIPENTGSLYQSLEQAARYSLFSGGKRLRPLLTLSTADAIDVRWELVIDAACAIELIHTYSLIHDDLPCMDNDDLRRGKPTLHKVYPEGHAVLCGDFLLTKAFETLSECPLSADSRIRLIQEVAKRAGPDLVGGQVLDLEAESKNVNEELLKQIHLKKTASLFEASFLIPSFIDAKTASWYPVLKEIGRFFGLAYQLQDDIEDADQDLEKKKKASYIFLIGIQRSQELLESYLQDLEKFIDKLPRPEPLKEFISQIFAGVKL